MIFLSIGCSCALGHSSSRAVSHTSWEIATLWHATYWVSGAVKAVTALASVPTAILLIRLLPDAFQIPSYDALRAEIADRERTQARFEGLLEAAPDAVVVVKQGEISPGERSGGEVFGYRRENILGSRLRSWSRSGLGRNREPEGFFAEPRREMGAGLELLGLRKDGTEFPVEISLSPLETERVLVSSAIRDIRRRKKADQKFRGLLEAAPDAMVVIIAKARSSSSTRRWKIFGYQREELLGNRIEM